ncbi:MAG: LysR family transcriptional regulator [Pseudomonadota bacterium]
MRLDWIEDLIALLDAGGVAEAARKRNVTQPAFSRRIMALEDVLGLTLIDRSVRPSGPTALLRDHGDRFRRLADEQRALIAAMRQAQRVGAPQLVVVCQHAITTSLGPRIVEHLRRAASGSVRLRSANRDQCETMLFSGTAAISVTYRNKNERAAQSSPMLTEAMMGTDRFIPVVGQKHAKRLMWEMHKGRLTIIGYPMDVFLGNTFSRRIAPSLMGRCELNVAAETALTPAAMEMARAGVGIAWVPAALAGEAVASGDLVELSDELGSTDLQIIAQAWDADADADGRIAKAWAALVNVVTEV